MRQLIRSYFHWLHGQWPAGTVEKMPEVQADFTTNVPGLYVVGDLTGVPLLKMSADSGTRAIRHLLADRSFQTRSSQGSRGDVPLYDVVIIGAGVSGYAAALEALANNLKTVLLEASEPLSTIVNFPKGKPIYTYPSEMKPAGVIQFHATVKEPLLDELRAQTAQVPVTRARVENVVREGGLLKVVCAGSEVFLAHRVVVAIGRSGNYRKLGVPGEALDKVSNRLHDPKDYQGKDVLVVGGGDSALETAIAVAEHGGRVTLSYRKPSFSRPKPENAERIEALQRQAGPGAVSVLLGSQVREIQPKEVVLTDQTGAARTLPNDVVFTMVGREAPLDFFRRSGVRITGESTPKTKLALGLFALFVVALYDWKNYAFLNGLWSTLAFPLNVPELFAGLGEWWQAQVADRTSLIGTLAISMKSRSFYYTLLYTSAIGWFGIQRIRRRQTPYVTLQTTCLFLIQLFPLFLLPELILPYLDYQGFFQTGLARTVADNLFELYVSTEAYAQSEWGAGHHSRAFWRAYGFILAWPLNAYNVNTGSPLPWWLAIGFLQTFVLIPAMVYRWGKGAYCSWICSCGALAETMGDAQRHKMPHGPFWNKLNTIGQVFLAFAALLFVLRVLTWHYPTHWIGGGGVAWLASHFTLILDGKNQQGVLVNPFSYNWMVDILWGGMIGVAFYFKYSGRVWCRFACPLAALMHIYARFSSFRILAEKKKCISCNVCTSVCHQGIDVMAFANKGLPMEDPQCVRCSACVQSCPTGTLTFGRVDRSTGRVLGIDSLPASPVQMMEV